MRKKLAELQLTEKELIVIAEDGTAIAMDRSLLDVMVSKGIKDMKQGRLVFSKLAKCITCEVSK